MAEKNVYKDTLNLLTTGFDMKANLLNKEPAMQAKWKQDDLYGQIRRARDGATRFLLHDGPPYANGNIHIGTALNKILKDMVVRIRNMEGMDSPYVPGWDCHGLPIEAKVADDLGGKIAGMDPLDIRRRCQEYAAKFQKLQSDQFQRLGVMGDFDNPYITMDPQYEASTLEVFAKLVERGLVYKQLKPVHWSIENRTALAEAELEYKDKQDTSIYVAFELTDESAAKVPGRVGKVYLAIWTTTPWTLPANLAVAVHPDFEYASVQCGQGDDARTLIMAKDRLAAFQGAACKGQSCGGAIVGTCRGSELAGLTYKHPLFAGKTCPVVTADYVTLEDGTGLVHTAPGHGIEDYGTGLKNKLEIYCPVQADGTFDDTAPEFIRGMRVWKANPVIVEHLKQAGTLLAEEVITHSYPHDWRSKTPTIFRATEQWFIGVDRSIGESGLTLRQLAMQVCRTTPEEGGVQFVPDWGRNRMAGMLDSRPDWCISRQRSWGLPIPAFYNAQGLPLLTAASVRAAAATIAKHGSDAWFRMMPAELLAGYDPRHDPQLTGRHEQFKVSELTVGRDIFDVWFESGSSWFAVCLARSLASDVPVDLYLEGSDQHRGWFQLSMLPCLGATNNPPFKALVTHGFVVDPSGKKISKSDPNCPTVIDLLKRHGADILRLYVASADYQDDIRYGVALIEKAEDNYRKIRNTFRYMLGSLYDFDAAVDATEPADHSIDRWMRMQLHMLIRDVRAAFDAYEFHKATRLLHEFCNVQASSIYFSALKDRLYCESPNAIRRRASQTVLHEMLMALVKLFAPILPHTAEEVWAQIPHRPATEPASVHLARLPEVDANVLRMADDLTPSVGDQAAYTADVLRSGPAWIWSKLMDLRGEGLVKLEALRNAGVKNPLDAEVIFRVSTASDATAVLFQTYCQELEDMLGVGFARIERAKLAEGKTVEVEVADTREKYPSCARSWKRRPDVGQDAAYPDLSLRDAVVMKERAGK